MTKAGWRGLRAAVRAHAGTKAGAARPIGGGLAVIDVNPYGCNAPAVPLQSWNIDLQQNYLLHGITLNALAIPSQGDGSDEHSINVSASLAFQWNHACSWPV